MVNLPVLRPIFRVKTIAFLLFSVCCICCRQPDPYGSWAHYGGSSEMIRYSSLQQIDTGNVAGLTVAWQYHTGDADTASHSQIQCNPIIADGILYGVSPQMKLFAVDAATGKEKWVFDANAKTMVDGNRKAYHILINSRGIAYWTDGRDDKRIFFTAGSNTYAINALTGKPIAGFGNGGYIDLHRDLGREADDLFIVGTSPGVVYRDLLIMGARVDENTPAAPGHIRAYDVRTGKLRWIFHTIPQPGEPGFETWEDSTAWKHIGGANVWSGFSLDEKRGILFAPTGSAVYDFYGGRRKGANLYANCLLALDAATGRRIWHYQFVHHDVWDRDLPTPPALVTLRINGKTVDAVAQPTKQGYVYVFERETGKPVFEIKEQPVDTLTELPGEKLWPTQPIPVKPAPFARQTLTATDINPYLPDSSRRTVEAQMKQLRFGKPFLPPSTRATLVFPGYDGGAEWGGPAFDPETGIFYVNANEMPWIQQMVYQEPPRPVKENFLQAGIRLFKTHCSSCHGANLGGQGNAPALTAIDKRYNEEQLSQLITAGRRMMPAFNRLTVQEKQALGAYLLNLKTIQTKPFKQAQNPADSLHYIPYKISGYIKFLSPEGLPAISPPWGTLNAINLNTGELVWKTNLGELEALKKKGIAATGTENYGGPVVTAGGVLFIAATPDGKMRAFHKTTGRLLWEYQLPAPGFATPAVYEVNGKQYLVVACGGGKLGTVSGDSYIAFSLP